MLRSFFQAFWIPIYRLWGLRYIRKKRTYSYAGIRIEVPPNVFHPGIFFSTPIFIDFLKKENFSGKKTLDIGTGSGMLALFTAKNGAESTALDINPLAVQTAKRNALHNGLNIAVWESDLLTQVPQQLFDFVLINPPYYPKKPQDMAEYAFFAGEQLEYFEKLFHQLPPFLHPKTKTWFILSEDCDFDKIQNIAAKHGFLLQNVHHQKKWGERLFIAQATLSTQTA